MKTYLFGAALSLLIAYGLSTPFAGRWMLERVAGQYPEVSVDGCPNADAIVVLSGTGPPRVGPLPPGETLNRIEAGVALYHSGRAPYLAMAASGEEQQGLRDLPEKSVVIVSPARDTA